MIDKNLNPKIAQETSLRRTFAIISHPDAGKTTLTEKLLLYAGMVRTAGMVRGRKSQKHTSSDWMELERERGISITASAMQFGYKGAIINVLDTPGHQDFSEDTYRTLTAADSAVMVIDAAKGVEAQTRKLFAVCKMRGIPVLTFINKLDLPGRDPLDLITEVEDALGIQASPLFWPVGMGKEFIGIIDRQKTELICYEKSGSGGAERLNSLRQPLEQALESGLIPNGVRQVLIDELDLLAEAGNSFDTLDFLAGKLTPVFFGSALTNFGVEAFFDAFTDLAPAPTRRSANNESGEEIFIDPTNEPFSAYVFKVQANMDPKHRDSMAYLRICSGQFERDLVVKHQRLKKEIRLSRSHTMFGGERSTIDSAFPGDVVGVVNPGVFAIGDTVSLRGGFNFKPLPKFPPEVIARIRPKNIMRKKAFDKAMLQFSSEGAVLVLNPAKSGSNDFLVAAVGPLQFEVLQHRLSSEYGVEAQLEQLPFQYGAWLRGDPDTFQLPSNAMLAKDYDNNAIMLYSNRWERDFAQEKNREHTLLDFIE